MHVSQLPSFINDHSQPSRLICPLQSLKLPLAPLQAGMDLRVLHAVAHGQTWYGCWRYEFGRGTFNIPLTRWEAAVRKLHRAQLAALWPGMTERGASATPLAAVLQRYAGSSSEV